MAVHPALGWAEPLCEAIGMTPLGLGLDPGIILGWNWISSQGPRFLYPQGRVTGGGPQAPGPPFYPSSARRPLSSARLGADQSWRVPPHATPGGALDAHPDSRQFRLGGPNRSRARWPL